MASTGYTERGSIIKFCFNLGNTHTQTRTLLEDANVKPPVSHALFFKWHGRYKHGRQSLDDDSGHGKMMDRRNVVLVDRRLKLTKVCDETGLSYGTVYRILTNELNSGIEIHLIS